MGDTLVRSQPLKLKGRLQAVTVLYLSSAEPAVIELELSNLIKKAPKLFDQAPLVLDCASLESTTLDLGALCRQLRRMNLLPIGIQGAAPQLATVAQGMGLAVFRAGEVATETPCAEAAFSAEPPPARDEATKLVAMPVRSGQQVVSRGGDLIVMGSVSHGAELLAAGHIHVYGALRGRALAGILGNKDVRIFCQSLDAELISIAGIYSLSDTITHMKVPCQIFLQDDRIQIEPL